MVLDNQDRSPEADVGEKAPGNGGPQKGKAKGNRARRQLIAMSAPSLPIQIPGIGNRSVEDDPVKLRLPDHKTIISFLDVRKDDREISLIVPPLQIVSSDSRFRKRISKHEDPDGTREFLQVLRILVLEDRRTDHFVEDAMCVDD